jgi:putative lipoprotein (rSAM/lipoprotein system)
MPVQGKVVSLSNDQAINNIQVVMKGDTVMTDQNGNYQVADKFGFPTDQTYTVRFKDVDGALNGVYDNLDTVVEFKNPKFINGDGHWYKGETEKDVTVKLSPKK